jgi:hypothetical protein
VCLVVLYKNLMKLSLVVKISYNNVYDLEGGGMFGGRREAVLAWAKAFYSVFLRLAAYINGYNFMVGFDASLNREKLKTTLVLMAYTAGRLEALAR